MEGYALTKAAGARMGLRDWSFKLRLRHSPRLPVSREPNGLTECCHYYFQHQNRNTTNIIITHLTEHGAAEHVNIAGCVRAACLEHRSFNTYLGCLGGLGANDRPVADLDDISTPLI
ncbi:hypothetical protein V2G26_020098 [Clonostachys chloroleuca]